MKEYLDRDDLYYPFVSESKVLTEGEIKSTLKSLLDYIDEKKVYEEPNSKILEWHLRVTGDSAKALRRVELFNKKNLLSALLRLRLVSNFRCLTGRGAKLFELFEQYGKTDSLKFLKALSDVEKIIKELILVNGPTESGDIIDHILYMIDDIEEDEGIIPMNVAEVCILDPILVESGVLSREDLVRDMQQRIIRLERSLNGTKLHPDKATLIRAKIKGQIAEVAEFISNNLRN